MDMIKWYQHVVLKNYVNFSGRASRAEFWWFFLANFIISFILSFIDNAIGTGRMISSLYSLAVLLPSLGLEVRRLHDIGKSGWNLLWGLIPFVGVILLIIWWVKEGDLTDNTYGPVPPTIPPEA